MPSVFKRRDLRRWFDYRHYGASDGEPRELLSISRQLDDWRAAIAFGKQLPGVDPARIAVWGSSFGGGHVLTLAAEAPKAELKRYAGGHFDYYTGARFETIVSDELEFLQRVLR